MTEELPEAGPAPEGDVYIFGQRSQLHSALPFGGECMWTSELFPFMGIIVKKYSGYEWRLQLHTCFGSRDCLGKGTDQEFEIAKGALELAACDMFKAMRWFSEERY